MRTAKCTLLTPHAKSTLCNLHFAFQESLKRLSERDVPGRGPFARLGVDLETHIEPDRPDGRLVAYAESDRGPQQPEIDVGWVGEHVAGVDEADTLEPPAYRAAQLDVEDGLPVPADRV